MTVAVPDPVTLFGVIDPQARPVGTVSVIETVPVNPPTAVIVIVVVVDTPVFAGVGAEAVIVKSGPDPGTSTVTVAEWLSDPLVPLTVIV